MKLNKTTYLSLLSLLLLSSCSNKRVEWENLLDSDLSKWENYLSYRFEENYNGNIPKDEDGNIIQPVGYNKDETKVFSVLDESEGPILRISGEIYGCLFTKKSYKNYHLKLKVKWGEDKYVPRQNLLKDSGILYHSVGEAGVEYWRSWMLSQEFQVMEGHMGDFWCQANSVIDIRSYHSEAGGIMSPVADESQPFRTFRSGEEGFCMRSANYESPVGEWTTLELVCYEGQSLHIVNGRVVMVLKDSSYSLEDGSLMPLIEGKIQIQSEAAEVFYKDIKIRELDEMPVEYQKLFES
ncbi:3-keto-disaccharide hydrolase [Jiulongibacter sp. NS-SX5]|uniref:3-keto-disaccharide hydrolase n=1 Tax=Jiulongibacter sp. NS-SX5 TaxID=3463854 RepID=UPI0040588C62